MKKQIIAAVKMLLLLTLVTGVIYPLVITGIAQIVFPAKANGSLIASNGRVIGSGLIGQGLDSVIYFHSRPSAVGYNPMPSGGSNWGPTADTLRKIMDANRTAFIHDNGLDSNATVPIEMITASASGLDPDISPEAVRMQVNRVASARHFSAEQTEKLRHLVESMVTPPQFGILGDSRINVLALNLAVDSLK
jgi:K+-transporting ATPase ATPase C chain